MQILRKEFESSKLEITYELGNLISMGRADNFNLTF